MNYYKVYTTNESVEENPRREWEWAGIKYTLSHAVRLAKCLSNKAFEAEVRGYDSADETICHRYYRKGKLHIDMLK